MSQTEPRQHWKAKPAEEHFTRVTIWLPRTLHSDLRAYAGREDRSIAWVGRKAIEGYLSTHSER